MNTERLFLEFRRNGIMSARAVASALGVSQPTASRLLSTLPPNRIMRLGRARNTTGMSA